MYWRCRPIDCRLRRRNERVRAHPEAQIALGELILQSRGGASVGEAYYWARLAEWRLPPSDLRTRASSIAKRAAASMMPEEITGCDQIVDRMIVKGAKAIR